MNAIFKFVGKMVFENPARKKSYAQLSASLERGGRTILERFNKAGETPKSIELLRHITTIERWGANRLRVILGEKSFDADSSKAYAPAANATWAELLKAFRATRAETVALSQQLEARGSENCVPHNQMGELSGKGWLNYLASHSDLESRKLRV
jgi:DinB superfamily